MHNDPQFGGNCSLYRQNVFDRAPGGRSSYRNHELGSIWIDDALGAVLATLEHLGEIDNTFILFQMDHGQEGKGSLFEPGLRLAQFIYYPDAFPSSSTFDGLVSTIDIGPTMLEYAGITSADTGYYDMDGMSWKNSVEQALTNPTADTEFDDRCLIFEMDRDRAIRCGCDKYIRLNNATEGGHVTKINSLGGSYVAASESLYNVCDGTDYAGVTSSVTENPEAVSIDWMASLNATDKMLTMSALLDCHDIKTSPARIPDYTTTCGDDSYCQDFDTIVQNDGGIIDCDFVMNADSCDSRNNQYRCMVTCGNCPATTVDDIIRLARDEIRDMIMAEPFWAGKFIRMGFHDSVGGVDGCIDMQNGDNAGLQDPIDKLADVVAKYEDAELGISRADIWALATLVGADTAQPAASQGRFLLSHVGRVNCDDDPNAICPNGCNITNGPDRGLPSPHLTTHELLDFFSAEYGFTNDETVALMGAHTLGSMSPDNSGFNGTWVSNENTLNNQYYEVLIGGTNGASDSEETMIRDAMDWEIETVDNSGRIQWFHLTPANVKTAMTNSDIALVRDLDGYLTDDGDSTCRFKCRNDQNCANTNLATVCPAATALLGTVANYKQDNDLWVSDFEAVLMKMMNNGYDASSTCMDDVCVLGLISEQRNLRGLN